MAADRAPGMAARELRGSSLTRRRYAVISQGFKRGFLNAAPLVLTEAGPVTRRV